MAENVSNQQNSSAAVNHGGAAVESREIFAHEGDDFATIYKDYPVGFRFVPTDAELIEHYLIKKLNDMPLPPNKNIHEVDLYGSTPSQLTQQYKQSDGGEEWYFFTPRNRKYPNGKRPNRAAGNGDGYWKPTADEKPVVRLGQKDIIGYKRNLDYYEGLHSDEWDLVKLQVREALEEYGGFEALFDKLAEVRKAVFGAMEELFDLPLKTKQLFTSDRPFGGYHDAMAKLLRESVMIDEAHVPGNIDRGLTNILWPQGSINFSKTIESFTHLAAGLEKTIMRMVLESFGVEKYTDELIYATNYTLRAIKYGRPQTGNEPTLGADAHTNKIWITLLYQNEMKGLEILTKDGEWINIKPPPNSFIILSGESLGVWLNVLLSVPYNRVVTKGNKVRYSIAVFANPRGGYPVKVPEEFVDGKNGSLFKLFDYDEYLQHYASQIAALGVFTELEVYCKV
ncbi:probable 2-oxoglutarate-dependent dioxygenase AOP1 [Hibiscus syriacus]|uniref:probable 2-oxoglutarate-dependent dioxygenase AOP1 n=1 Tax=Hibiscus syriacus TaxID=106335 RepID=UPI00192342E1|nr:probable 2-oxoglutarate-dependent dioxygenase AOP1 [Hibiscus syriacus]